MSLPLSITTAFLIVFLGLLAAISARIEKKKKTNKSIRQLNTIFKLIIGASALLFIAMVWQAILENSKKEIFAPKIAQLDICPYDSLGGQNPILYINKAKDSIACKILYCNIGNDNATYISDTMIAITYPHGKIKYDTIGINSVLNESEIIAPNKSGKGMLIKLYSPDKRPLDNLGYTIYMYLKVYYSNS